MKQYTKFIVFGVASCLFLLISGCATTTRIEVAQHIRPASLHSVYFVAHGGNSSDVDGYIRRALLRHNLTETEGMDKTIQGHNADIVVTYGDDWSWDISMYLNSIDIQFFDGKTGTLIAECSWENSAMHGFPNVENVVNNLIDQAFIKMEKKQN